MATPLQTNYVAGVSVDDETSLAQGVVIVTTSLTAELSADELDKILIDNGGIAPKVGTAKIDDEVIYYHCYDKTDPTCILDLIRGQEDTTPAIHLVGAEVLLIGAPRFANPALPAAVIAIQNQLVSGVSGSFTTGSGKSVTVVDGIITGIEV